MKSLIKLIIPIAFIFISQLQTFAQSNEIIDSLLSEKYADYGKAAYLTLSAANLVDRNAIADNAAREALSFLKGSGWKLKIKSPDEKINLGEYCLLVMKSFKMQGGVMYFVFPSPRYASRELYSLGFIDGSKDPYRKISGEEAVSILQRVMEWEDENK